MEEAQSLSLRKQLGGGSKWLTWVVLILILIGVLLAFYQQIVREVSPAYRPYVIAGLGVLIVGMTIWKRLARKNSPQTTRVEISETEFVLLGPDSRVAMPWSAFGDCLESPKLFALVDRPKGILFVVPKRAFASEDAQDWFRTLAQTRPSRVEPVRPSVSCTPRVVSADQVALRFRLGYRDYLDRTVASYRTWGIYLVVLVMIIGITLYSAAHPPPHAVYSTAQVFFMFEVPFLFVMMAVMTLVISVYTWRLHAKYLLPQELVLSDNSLEFSGADGQGVLPWSTYTRYKETCWSFILWNPRTSLWTMLPKRAFASRNDLERCRSLLARHLLRSRWFFG
jgi:hypothetical protein